MSCTGLGGRTLEVRRGATVWVRRLFLWADPGWAYGGIRLQWWAVDWAETLSIHRTRPLPTGPCAVPLSSILGLAPFTGNDGGGISCLLQEGRRHFKCVPKLLKPQRDATYLSLSLRGPEELGSVGPALSELSTEKPAPKLVIWMGPCYEQKNTGSISRHPPLNPALKLYEWKLQH